METVLGDDKEDGEFKGATKERLNNLERRIGRLEGIALAAVAYLLSVASGALDWFKGS